MKDRFEKKLNNLLSKLPKTPTSFCIGVSGGADSLALCILLKGFCKKKKINLYAVTVDHQLRPEAKKEAKGVHDFLSNEGIYHEVLVWEHKDIKSDIENQARQARYDLIKNFCKKNKCEYLLTAHHKDDQIETFLINLSRGSGVYGLSGIKEISTQDELTLIRPLLSFSKEEILNFCKEQGIKFYHDNMNDDEKYLRVKIRKNRHLLNEKLDISDDKVILAIQNLSRVRSLIENLVQNHISDSQTQKNVFNKDLFLKADDEVILRSLSNIIMETSNQDYPPTLEKLENLLFSIRENKLPKTLQGVKIDFNKNSITFVKLK